MSDPTADTIEPPRTDDNPWLLDIITPGEAHIILEISCKMGG